MKCYKAKWILTSEDNVLEDSAIVVDEGKIIDIIPNSQVNFEQKYIKELGNSVITPGFIDMLTQFQYTDEVNNKPQGLKNVLKKLFITLNLKYTFAGVSPEIYSRKWAKALANYFTMDRGEKIRSFENGVNMAIKAGTTCIAQVSKEFKYFDVLNKMPIKNYLFFEVFADTSKKSKQQFKEIRAKVEDLIMHKCENTHIGIMLNSISGVHKKLWQLFSKYCRKHNMLLMTRFVESKDETEWLEHGFSDIDLLHKFMGMRKISPYAKDLDPVEYLDNIKVLTKKVIVANANYANDEELEKLAETGVKFIYQPTYSSEVCNRKLSLKTVLKYFPQNFGFSTQSFKADKDYSLLKEAVEADTDNELDIVELIKYLTIYPARILRLDNSIGSIRIGKCADFNVFKLEEDEDYRDLIKKHSPYATYSNGRKLVKHGDIRYEL